MGCCAARLGGCSRHLPGNLGVDAITWMMNALRRDDIIVVSGRVESAADTGDGEAGQGEVRGVELVVRTCTGRVGEVRGGHVLQAGTELVLRSGIGASTKVTTGAGLDTIATDLHIPKQCFTGARRGWITDEVAKVGECWHSDASQVTGEIDQVAKQWRVRYAGNGVWRCLTDSLPELVLAATNAARLSKAFQFA